VSEEVARDPAAHLAPNLVVLSGHSSEELATFVRGLGNAGVFADRVIVLQSCETPLNRQLAREIVSRYRAAAVFVYEGLIPVNDLEPATIDLVRALDHKVKWPGDTLREIRDVLGRYKLRAVPHVELRVDRDRATG
jgi:hypothetical protein